MRTGKASESEELARSKQALIQALIRAYMVELNNPQVLRRKRAARGLGTLGPAAREAVPALQAALSDGDRRVREVAAWALRRIRSAEADFSWGTPMTGKR